MLLAAAAPVTILYIARPSIAPDHLWAMRRYLPIVLPAMTIAAAAAAIWLAAAIGNWQPRLRAPFVVGAVAAMVVPAAASGLPFLGAQMQGGALDAIHRICRETGPDAAIAVEPYALLEPELPQTIRGFCGVPSAGLKAGHLMPLTTVARAWKNQNRQFYVVWAAAPLRTETGRPIALSRRPCVTTIRTMVSEVPATGPTASAHHSSIDHGSGPPTLDVSIILPVYNEAEHLEQEVDRVRTAMDASDYSYEIIVVDDGSSDNSAEVASRLPNIRFIQFLQNRGSGSARKAGTKAAHGRVTVWTDVDMTYPNDTMPQLVKELDGYDQVVGARTTEEGTLKALRVPAKWLIRKLASFLTSTKVPDLNSGFRAFRTDVARQYLNQLPVGFSCVTTITMTFLANGYSVKYIPIDYAKRAGESKFHWYKDTRRYATQVVRMILSYNPLRIFMPVGLTLFAIGFVKLLIDVIGKPDFRVPTNTLLILFAAFQVIVIGLLADLVTRATRAQDEEPPASV